MLCWRAQYGLCCESAIDWHANCLPAGVRIRLTCAALPVSHCVLTADMRGTACVFKVRSVLSCATLPVLCCLCACSSALLCFLLFCCFLVPQGDLDSVRQDVQDFYTSRGVPMIDLSSDQETTDLEKCLLFLEGRLRAMSEQRTPETPSAAEAAAPQHGLASETVLTAAAAAAAVAVSVNGLGHGAKAIGAVNAHKAPHGNGSSISHSSSCSVAYTQVGLDAAGVDSSVVQPEASTCAAVSNNTALSVQQLRQQRQADDYCCNHHHSYQHQHHNSRHHHHSQQQQQSGAVAPPVVGRIVMLDYMGSSVPMAGSQIQQQFQQQLAYPAEQEQQQMQAAGLARPPQTKVSASPGSPSSSSSSRGGTRGRARPSSSGSLSGGGVHEVAATVLGSSDTQFEPPAKRVQQQHVILVLGELGCERFVSTAPWGCAN